MTRAKYSPTVIVALISDRNWFEAYCEQYGFEIKNGIKIDIEGYNQYGYNLEGKDRAGHTQEDYASKLFYEVNDDLLDSGEELCFKVIYEGIAHGLYSHLCSKELSFELHIDQWNAEDIVYYYEPSLMFPTELNLREI